MNLRAALNFADSGETTGGTSTTLALARLAQEVRDLQKQLDEITDGRDRAMEDSDWARQYREACVKIAEQHDDVMRLEWIMRYWDSQAMGKQPLGLPGYFPNPTGSFRDAIDAAMREANGAAQTRRT